MMFLLRALAVWLLIIAVETVHGILRQFATKRLHEHEAESDGDDRVVNPPDQADRGRRRRPAWL
jgi:hypothetical protein